MSTRRKWLVAGIGLLAVFGTVVTLAFLDLRTRLAMDELRTIEMCGQVIEVADDYVGLSFGRDLGEPVPDNFTRYGIRPLDAGAGPPVDVMGFFASVPAVVADLIQELSYEDWAAERGTRAVDSGYSPGRTVEAKFEDGCRIQLRLESESRLGSLWGEWLFALTEIAAR